MNDLRWLLEHPEYEHRVVDILTFINSPDYLNAGIECWQSIKDDLQKLFNGNYTEAVFCEAIGAGKGYKASVIITYMLYRTLCLKDPQEFFGLAKGSWIAFINQSIRADQSKRVVFGELKSRIDNCAWFLKHYPPDPNIRSELRFPKNILVFPGNSQETFPLGFNVLGAIMDEAAYYTDTVDHDVAEDMFNALHSRIKNRFGDKGLMVMISSPRYVDDFIEKKMKEAETNPQIFSTRKKLWESKPASRFSGEWIDFGEYKIPAEFEIEAKRNPEAFKRDYMALPALALEPYFKNISLVEKCIDPDIESPFDENGKLKATFRGKTGKWYYIHIDLSHRRDATGFAMAHDEGDKVVVDLMLRIQAPPEGEIKFSDIRERIYELKERGFRIHKVTFDGWQSIDSMQILQKNGYRCETVSVDKDTAAYDTLKEKIQEGKLRFYRYDPFLQEAQRLELVDGNKVDHPHNGGSKDVADAVAGAVFQAVKNANTLREAKCFIV